MYACPFRVVLERRETIAQLVQSSRHGATSFIPSPYSRQRPRLWSKTAGCRVSIGGRRRGWSEYAEDGCRLVWWCGGASSATKNHRHGTGGGTSQTTGVAPYTLGAVGEGLKYNILNLKVNTKISTKILCINPIFFQLFLSPNTSLSVILWMFCVAIKD